MSPRRSKQSRCSGFTLLEIIVVVVIIAVIAMMVVPYASSSSAQAMAAARMIAAHGHHDPGPRDRGFQQDEQKLLIDQAK
jgi:prepilin-type N-terminal cleavage/methylation domain-containing protein